MPILPSSHPSAAGSSFAITTDYPPCQSFAKAAPVIDVAANVIPVEFNNWGPEEIELRKIWDEKGVSIERQNQLIADVTAKQPGAMVGPFKIPSKIPETKEDKYVVGAIIESSWGYEQTNIDFYRIEKRTKDTVWLIPLESIKVEDLPMQGKATPGEPVNIGDTAMGYNQMRFNGKLLRRKLQRNKEGNLIGCCIVHGWASLWDGKPSRYSSYN